jgi:hypothetical protein
MWRPRVSSRFWRHLADGAREGRDPVLNRGQLIVGGRNPRAGAPRDGVRLRAIER